MLEIASGKKLLLYVDVLIPPEAKPGSPSAPRARLSLTNVFGSLFRRRDSAPAVPCESEKSEKKQQAPKSMLCNILDANAEPLYVMGSLRSTASSPCCEPDPRVDVAGFRISDCDSGVSLVRRTFLHILRVILMESLFFLCGGFFMVSFLRLISDPWLRGYHWISSRPLL